MQPICIRLAYKQSPELRLKHFLFSRCTGPYNGEHIFLHFYFVHAEVQMKLTCNQFLSLVWSNAQSSAPASSESEQNRGSAYP